MTPHDVAHKLHEIQRELVEAEKFTNSCTCIDHIRNARDIAGKTMEGLGLPIIKGEFDPLM
jgi:hypothetical protein